MQDLISLKMRTRVSMGDCQGKMCVGYCSDRLREHTGKADVGWIRPRFPLDLAVLRLPNRNRRGLTMSRQYDIVIAGGGVIGASCAYQLSKRKDLKIALIDAKRPGNASRASAGGLWAIGESVGLGCGVIFFRMTSAKNKREAAGAAIAVDASTPHPAGILLQFRAGFQCAVSGPASGIDRKPRHGFQVRGNRAEIRDLR